MLDRAGQEDGYSNGNTGRLVTGGTACHNRHATSKTLSDYWWINITGSGATRQVSFFDSFQMLPSS